MRSRENKGKRTSSVNEQMDHSYSNKLKKGSVLYEEKVH